MTGIRLFVVMLYVGILYVVLCVQNVTTSILDWNFESLSLFLGYFVFSVIALICAELFLSRK
jgi:hypothetical protein